MPAVLLNYGAFIQTIVDFTIIALVIFLAIKAINRHPPSGAARRRCTGRTQ